MAEPTTGINVGIVVMMVVGFAIAYFFTQGSRRSRRSFDIARMLPVLLMLPVAYFAAQLFLPQLMEASTAAFEVVGIEAYDDGASEVVEVAPVVAEVNKTEPVNVTVPMDISPTFDLDDISDDDDLSNMDILK